MKVTNIPLLQLWRVVNVPALPQSCAVYLGQKILAGVANTKPSAIGDMFDVQCWSQLDSYFHQLGLQFCNPLSRTNDGMEFRYFGGRLANYCNAHGPVINSSNLKFVQAEVVNANTTAMNPSLHKTNHSNYFIAFKELAVGAPVYNVRDGWDEITKMVVESTFACNEESQSSNPVDK